MPQTVLAAFLNQSVARDCGPQLPLPQPHHRQRRVRLAVLYWLVLAGWLMGLLVAESLLSGGAERTW